MTRDNGEHEKD